MVSSASSGGGSSPNFKGKRAEAKQPPLKNPPQLKNPDRPKPPQSKHPNGPKPPLVPKQPDRPKPPVLMVDDDPLLSGGNPTITTINLNG
jgi:hypothetical protein